MSIRVDEPRCCSCLRLYTKARRRALLRNVCESCDTEIRRAGLMRAVERAWPSRAEAKGPTEPHRAGP